jgi:hypothetical protein
MALAPWLAWLAAITSLVLLLVRSATDEGTRGSWLGALWIWFLAAAGFQFYGTTAVANASGLAAQTVPAVLLLVWWRSEV